MYEQEKLKEARHFFQRMVWSANDPTTFQYELSAFLCSARSVLQYALEEAKDKPGGKQWYDTQVSGHSVLKFFKEKRDFSIHEEPVVPSRHISASGTIFLMITESARLEIQNEDGTVEVREFKGQPPEQGPQVKPAEATSRYVFDDWKGSEDVLDLSQQYLVALDDFVKRGLADGFISE